VRFAVDGPAVIVPGRLALLLERHLRLDRVRLDVRGADAELDALLSSWHAVSLLYAERAVPASGQRGSSVDPTPEAGRRSDPMKDLLSAQDVADAVDVSSSAVRLAARQGRLAGQKVDGEWSFHRHDVAAWVATRQR
jgi:hypothetical protein